MPGNLMFAVVIDPELSGGRPTMAGTGVAVDIVADLADAGESVHSIAKEFGVSRSLVRDVIDWHRSVSRRGRQ